MAMKRGEIWWADLPDSAASEPGFRRPLLIVQIDNFNRSCIRTVVVVILTTNLRLSEAQPEDRLTLNVFVVMQQCRQ